MITMEFLPCIQIYEVVAAMIIRRIQRNAIAGALLRFIVLSNPMKTIAWDPINSLILHIGITYRR